MPALFFIMSYFVLSGAARSLCGVVEGHFLGQLRFDFRFGSLRSLSVRSARTLKYVLNPLQKFQSANHGDTEARSLKRLFLKGFFTTETTRVAPQLNVESFNREKSTAKHAKNAKG